MRRDAPAAGTELSEQMGKLVPQGALDFRGVVFAQKRISRDKIAPRIGAAGGAGETRVPFDVNLCGQRVGIEGAKDFARFAFERCVATEDNERRSGWKNEIELSIPRFLVAPGRAPI